MQLAELVCRDKFIRKEDGRVGNGQCDEEGQEKDEQVDPVVPDDAGDITGREGRIHLYTYCLPEL